MLNSSSLLSHVLSQTKDNLDFLVSQGQLTPHDVGPIISKLSDVMLAAKTQGLEVGSQFPARDVPQSIANPVPSTKAVNPPSMPPNLSNTQTTFRAKAIWGYNEEGSESDDLSFRSGDIIEVTFTTNADWWTGRYNGREGLFPSNYVERLQGSSRPPPPPPPPPTHNYNSEKAPGGPPPFMPGYQPPSFPPPNQYSAPGAAHYPYNSSPYPPPPMQGPGPYSPYNHNIPPVPVQAPPSAPQEQPQEPKKSKFGLGGGGLGNTLAHSAVGGVGFGAGSAVGSGIINSIF